jgi:hypothetical protein
MAACSTRLDDIMTPVSDPASKALTARLPVLLPASGFKCERLSHDILPDVPY